MLHSRLSFQEIITDGEKHPPVAVGEPLLGIVWVPMLCIMCPCVLARAKTRSVDMHAATLWCHGNSRTIRTRDFMSRPVKTTAVAGDVIGCKTPSLGYCRTSLNDRQTAELVAFRRCLKYYIQTRGCMCSCVRAEELQQFTLSWGSDQRSFIGPHTACKALSIIHAGSATGSCGERRRTRRTKARPHSYFKSLRSAKHGGTHSHHLTSLTSSSPTGGSAHVSAGPTITRVVILSGVDHGNRREAALRASASDQGEKKLSVPARDVRRRAGGALKEP
ncbi:hypothetical protein NQZ68_014751 [Dissostichus eleginoides]|nr:hypothetical protein NQZ68_014751 [Dissostichus eleginoides]